MFQDPSKEKEGCTIYKVKWEKNGYTEDFSLTYIEKYKRRDMYSKKDVETEESSIKTQN